ASPCDAAGSGRTFPAWHLRRRDGSAAPNRQSCKSSASAPARRLPTRPSPRRRLETARPRSPDPAATFAILISKTGPKPNRSRLFPRTSPDRYPPGGICPSGGGTLVSGAAGGRGTRALTGAQLLTFQLVRQGAGVVQLAQGLGHGARMDGDGAVVLDVIDVVADQAFDVAVEDQPHQLGVPVDHGRAGVPADDVAGADKIDGRRKLERAPAVQITLRQIERR